MTIPSAKRSVLALPSVLTRRHFMSGTATIAGGAAAGTLLALSNPSDAATPAANPPTDYDPRTLPINYLTAVKDQDHPNPCNACTAYAVVAAVEAAYNKAKNQQGSQGPDLDEMDLFSNPGPQGGCAATHWWPKAALNYCQTPGLKWQSSASNSRIKIAPPVSLLDDSNLNKTQRAMKEWISTHGPVVGVMVQYEDFYSFGKAWSATHGTQPNPNVYSLDRKNPGRIVGGHSIAIVGYTGDDHWICKNSWGSGWNGDGYVRIAQGKNAFAETYIDRIDVWGVTVV